MRSVPDPKKIQPYRVACICHQKNAAVGRLDVKCSCAAGCCRVPLRYTVAMVGFFGIFCALACRGCINVAIVVMTNYTDDDDGQFVNGSVDRCPPHDSQNVTVRPSPQVCGIQSLVIMK